MHWWQADGAEIAFGISALFLAAAWAMHRVIRRVLRAAPVALDEGRSHE